MARIRFECKCSWIFFVPDSTGAAFVKCPSCATPHAVPRKEAEEEPRKDGSRRRLYLVGGLVAFAITAIGGVLLFSGGSKDPEPEPKKSAAPEIRQELQRQVEKKFEAPAVELAAPDPHQQLDEAVYVMNVAGIASEYCRFAGDAKKAAEFQETMRTHLRQYEDAADRIARRGEKHFLPDFLRPGDRIVRFEGQDLKDDGPKYAMNVLAGFLRDTLKPTVFAECTVARGREQRNLLMFWGAVPKICETFVAVAKVVPIETRKPEPVAKLQPEVKKELNALPEYYRALLPPEERERVDRLLRKAEGVTDDESLRVLEEWKSQVDAELRLIRDYTKSLESAALAAPKADVVHLKNGTKKEGTILEDTAEHVRLEMKIGNNKASIKYARADVVRVELGKGSGGQFAERLQKAGDKPASLAELLKWCGDSKLSVQADYVAWKMLSSDPDSAVARQHLGFVRDPTGVWRREEAVEMEAGKYRYQGQWCTLEELERRLEKAGYVKKNGTWHAKKAWSVAIDNLYKETKVEFAFRGAAILDMVDEESGQVYDLQKREWVKKDKRISTGRYLGSRTRGNGVATLTVQAPGPIVRARVLAPGQTAKQGASLVVRAYGADARSAVTLYRISGKDADDKSREVPVSVLGSNRLVIEAQMYGDAMFLPCTRNDLGLFKVSAEILVPADTINKLLARE